MKEFPILFSRTANNSVQTWQIFTDRGSFYTIEGIKGGKMTQSKYTICERKNVGKANETSPQKQAEVEAQAKWEKQIKRGYFQNEKDIDNFTFVEPMLAKKFSDYKDKIVYPVMVDLKYNGTRIELWSKGAFSRQGHQFHSVPHLIEDTAKLFQKFPKLVLDGEAYRYELRKDLNQLIKLVSVGRKPKDLTPELLAQSRKVVQYHVYDAYGFADPKLGEITEETPCFERREALTRLLQGLEFTFPVKGQIAHNESEVVKIVDAFVADGQEGGIVRTNSDYQHKRSSNLLKVKRFLDEEFEIIRIGEGDGNWAGCAKQIFCKTNKPTTDGDDTFVSNVEGSMEFCREVLQNQKKYIGKRVTVRFQGYSEYGRPQIPYTDCLIRNYE